MNWNFKDLWVPENLIFVIRLPGVGEKGESQKGTATNNG